MNTEALIASLSSELQSVPRTAVARRLWLGLAGGGAVTLLIIVLGLKVRPDFGLAMHSYAFWMKWGYTLSLALCSVVVVARLSRPGDANLRPLWLLLIPFGALVVIGLVEMAHVPSGDWLSMWLGKTWKKCPWLVLMLSAPIFVGLLWSFRRLAPTRLRAAGAAAGLAAGAWAAALYCLHCPEVSAIFVLTWYTLGIALAAGIGALIGPRVLRW